MNQLHKCADCPAEALYVPVLVLDYAPTSVHGFRAYVAVELYFCKEHCRGSAKEYLTGREQLLESLFDQIKRPLPELKDSRLQFWPINKVGAEVIHLPAIV